MAVWYFRFMAQCREHQGRPLCLDQAPGLYGVYRAVLLSLAACHTGMLVAQFYSADYTSWGSFTVHPSKIFLHISSVTASLLLLALLVLGQTQRPRVPIPRALVLVYSALGSYLLQLFVVANELGDGRETVAAVVLTSAQCLLMIFITVGARARCALTLHLACLP